MDLLICVAIINNVHVEKNVVETNQKVCENEEKIMARVTFD